MASPTDAIRSSAHSRASRRWTALLDLSDPTNPREAEWPAAEFIVGNPPFLGGKLLRRGLGDAYVGDLFTAYDGRVPREADLVTYWHEKARAQISGGRTRRAGLLATQNIRGGANRRVLERITESGGIFFAYADEPWILSGANVHISFVGQDDGSDSERELDGQPVASINPNLTVGLDLTRARRLRENLGIAFQGVTLGGGFDVQAELAEAMLRATNPDGRTNADVVRPLLNAQDITGRLRGSWVIDFGSARSEADAALFEGPFEYVRHHVKPARVESRRLAYAQRWWLPMEARPGLRNALVGLGRFVATPITAKHRLFVWVPSATLPSVSVVAVARDDDYTFGVLHSRVHQLWALGLGTQLETRPRYTPTTCFETFPFPRPPDEQRDAIAVAARELVRLRDGWLNPLGLTEGELTKRTLTNLYNQRPFWLANAHNDLDNAVLAAYGWPVDLANPEILERLLALNLERQPA